MFLAILTIGVRGSSPLAHHRTSVFSVDLICVLITQLLVFKSWRQADGLPSIGSVTEL